MVYIGTSGYSYKDWAGIVYPDHCAAKDYLLHYAREFSFTELNFSYYKQPDVKTIGRLVHMTSDMFQFSIKAYKGITHDQNADLMPLLAEFKKGIVPLTESGKLSAVLLQFPYSFHYTPENRKRLQSIAEGFEYLPLAVEFRNSSWACERVYEGLRKYNIALTSVDEPPLDGLLKPSDFTTNSLGYIRFHGRNSLNWWNGDNASRYDYLYNKEELSEWIPRIKKIIDSGTKTIIAFNNHWRGQAVINGRQLRQMLIAAGVEVL